LVCEACDELVGAGLALADAEARVDAWLGQSVGGLKEDHRDKLRNPQQRSTVRRALRQALRIWTAEPTAE
jgi:hypothetical protein